MYYVPILRRPLKFDQISKSQLKLLNSVKKSLDILRTYKF